MLIFVVPYIGTWIETFENAPELGKEFVVPYIGTWIETNHLRIMYLRQKSYLI